VVDVAVGVAVTRSVQNEEVQPAADANPTSTSVTHAV
jgi:hypothetical protein